MVFLSSLHKIASKPEMKNLIIFTWVSVQAVYLHFGSLLTDSISFMIFRHVYRYTIFYRFATFMLLTNHKNHEMHVLLETYRYIG